MKRIMGLLVLGTLFSSVLFSADNLLYEENFSDGLTGWTTVDLLGSSSLWHKIVSHPMDSASYHSPDTSWWCGVEGDTYYPNYVNDAVVVTKVCDLTGKINPVIKFWQYLDIDNDSKDSATVDVSTDGGVTWHNGVGVWTTSSGSWQQVSVDLSAYIDSTIQFRFRFVADNYNITDGYGWFIDDILLADITSEVTVYNNTVENNDDFTTYNVIGSGLWQKVTDKSHSADTSYQSTLSVSNWTCLQSSEFDFSGLTNPYLEFYHYYKFAWGADVGSWSNGGIVEITTDTLVDSAAWVKLYPVGGYPASCTQTILGNPLGNNTITGDADNQGYYGVNLTWTQAQFDLSAYAGSPKVWIRFSAGTDQYLTDEEWRLDDITIIDQGASDTIHFCDMEDSNDVKFSTGGVVAGDWWRGAHSGFSQLASSPAYFSADSAAYCGNQASRYDNGTYAPIDNDYALIDNALVSPFITISAAGGGDDLRLYLRNRRYCYLNGRIIVDVKTSPGGAWTPADTFTTTTVRNGLNGGWMPESVDLSGFAAADSISIRFRVITPQGNSRVYIYLDDLRLVHSTASIIDFCEITENTDSYALTEKSDTFNVFDIEAFDAGAAAPETVTVTINDLDGVLTSAAFNALTDDATSGISVFDSSGTRISINAAQSGWNGLTAKLVLQSATAVPAKPVSVNAYSIKLRTSAVVKDGARFTVTLAAGKNIDLANGERLGTGADVTSGIFTVTNTAPAAPATASAIETGDSTGALLTWNAVSETDLAEYRIYRDTAAGFTAGTGNLITVLAPDDTVYTDTGLVTGYSYYYQIVAVDSGINTGSASPECSVATNVLPVAPTGIATMPDTGYQFIRLSWNAMGGDVVSYKVYRDTLTGFTAGSGNLLTTVANPDTEYVDSAVVVGKIYFYLISAVDDVGGEGPVSGEADSPVPVVLTALNVQMIDGAVVIIWTTASEEDNLGWHILRTSVDGLQKRVNDVLIPGAGTSNMPSEYSFADDNAATGEVTYTLQQVDLTGRVTAVGTAAIVVDGTSGIGISSGKVNDPSFSVVPTTDGFKLVSPVAAKIVLYVTDGRKLQSWDVLPGGAIRWNGVDATGMQVAKGVYLLSYRSSTGNVIIKILK